MSENAHTPLKSEQNGDGVASKSSDRKASSKTPINAANKKNGVNLTPVESLLFFNIVRFNKDPGAIDWVQVAKHSNLKNPGSAKVRFRQIQKKYGLEINASSRPGKRKTLDTAAEDNEECEDDDDTDETPSKKRSKNLSSRRSVPNPLHSRMVHVVHKDLDSADGSPASTATDGPGPSPDPSVKQGQYARMMKDEEGQGIKRESPVRQVQVADPDLTHPNGPSDDHLLLQQQQRGHEQLSHLGSVSSNYSTDGTQHSGVSMFQGMSPFQHASTMANSRQSQVLTPQQQAYLQNLHRLHQERLSQQDPYMGYGQNEAQTQNPAYLTQQAGGQYGQYAVSPSATYAQGPQAYFDPQTQGNGVQTTNKPPSRVPTRASTQSPAISHGDDKAVHSSGDGFFASVPEPPVHPFLDEMVHMPESAAGLAGTSPDPTSL